MLGHLEVEHVVLSVSFGQVATIFLVRAAALLEHVEADRGAMRLIELVHRDHVVVSQALLHGLLLYEASLGF